MFLIRTPEGTVVYDTGTYSSDISNYLAPALQELGMEVPVAVVLSHNHGDHAGGLPCILEHAPQIEAIRAVRELLPGVFTYPMAGHTADSIGVLDTRTGTLISGDGLQGAGVDRYPCFTEAPDAYVETVGRIRKDARIENVLFSHAYEPWNSDRAEGRPEVLSCLDACLGYVSSREK